jgi:hypothetical protein
LDSHNILLDTSSSRRPLSNEVIKSEFEGSLLYEFLEDIVHIRTRHIKILFCFQTVARNQTDHHILFVSLRFRFPKPLPQTEQIIIPFVSL